MAARPWRKEGSAHFATVGVFDLAVVQQEAGGYELSILIAGGPDVVFRADGLYVGSTVDVALESVEDTLDQILNTACQELAQVSFRRVLEGVA